MEELKKVIEQLFHAAMKSSRDFIKKWDYRMDPTHKDEMTNEISIMELLLVNFLSTSDTDIVVREDKEGEGFVHFSFGNFSFSIHENKTMLSLKGHHYYGRGFWIRSSEPFLFNQTLGSDLYDDFLEAYLAL